VDAMAEASPFYLLGTAGLTLFEVGERGRNRTYNLLIKSHSTPPQDQQDKACGSVESGKVLQNPQPRRNQKDT